VETAAPPCVAIYDAIASCVPYRGEVELKTNFVSDKPSSWYSDLYKKDGLAGGHVIMLGADDASKWV
jgi:hypothetical protein